jgi:hypothetical protein
MDKITIRKSSCNKLKHSKDYYEKHKDYYKEYQKNYYEKQNEHLKQYQKDYYINNKQKKQVTSYYEKKKLYNRNYIRQKNNYKSVKQIDERFDTNLTIDSFENFDEFFKDLNI